jgi:hypothetical protein
MKKAFGKLLLLVLINTPFFLFVLIVTLVLSLGYYHDTDPQHYEEVVSELLGVQDFNIRSVPVAVDGKETVIQPFTITYWNGNEVEFYAPPEVWDPVWEAYMHFPWCDPRLNIAVAFSESSSYTNYRTKNRATAIGTWQFIDSTWERLWAVQIPELHPELLTMFPNPDRTDRRASAYAACVYYRLIGLDDAYSKGEEAFVKEFMGWNRHEGQARFVYRLYSELLSRTGGLPTVNTPEVNRVVLEPSPWKKFVLEALQLLGIFPKVAYAYDDSPGEGLSSNNPVGGDGECKPLIGGMYTIGPRGYHTGCEGTSWSCGLIRGYDYIAPDRTPLYAPMNGVVTAMFYDGLGNSILALRLENGLELGIMHLHFAGNIAVGSQVVAGQEIGKVGNIGNSTTAHAHVWLRQGSSNIQDHSVLFCK